MAESTTEMKEMIKRLKKYLDKKKMILHAEKTKIIEFRQEKGREGCCEKIKYLEYIFQTKNQNGKHRKENVEKARSKSDMEYC